jgi:two-component system, OmpR family, response regulator CpxR
VRILLIDDDTELCSLLKEFLELEGFSVAVEYHGEQGLERALAGDADLVVLDLMLPGTDGFSVLRRLRARKSIPVLILTARGEERDRISGLELGADDYLAKPFNPRELLARIRAILRRVHAPPRARLQIHGVTLDPGSREAFCEGQPIPLTSLEFDVLETLMTAAGRVVSRDELMERLYGRKATPFDRSVDMHVSHVRKKLESSGTLIKTVRGIGYQFSRSSQESDRAPNGGQTGEAETFA